MVCSSTESFSGSISRTHIRQSLVCPVQRSRELLGRPKTGRLREIFMSTDSRLKRSKSSDRLKTDSPETYLSNKCHSTEPPALPGSTCRANGTELNHSLGFFSPSSLSKKVRLRRRSAPYLNFAAISLTPNGRSTLSSGASPSSSDALKSSPFVFCIPSCFSRFSLARSSSTTTPTSPRRANRPTAPPTRHTHRRRLLTQSSSHSSTPWRTSCQSSGWARKTIGLLTQPTRHPGFTGLWSPCTGFLSSVDG